MPRRADSRKPIREIRRSLRVVERALAKLTLVLSKSGKSEGGPVARRRPTITPARRAQLKLQGQYMGYMRQLKPKQKAQARAAKEKGGYTAGIRMARKLAQR